MKHVRILPVIALITLLVFSCKKENVVANHGLVGTWWLVEVYDGHANGGTYTWHTVSAENAHSLLFAADRQYIRKENSGGAFQQCTGTYELSSENRVEVRSGCQTVTETMKVSELSKRLLVINRAGREGAIRYKYRVE